jgi:hypothetical protein
LSPPIKDQVIDRIPKKSSIGRQIRKPLKHWGHLFSNLPFEGAAALIDALSAGFFELAFVADSKPQQAQLIKQNAENNCPDRAENKWGDR